VSYDATVGEVHSTVLKPVFSSTCIGHTRARALPSDSHGPPPLLSPQKPFFFFRIHQDIGRSNFKQVEKNFTAQQAAQWRQNGDKFKMYSVLSVGSQRR
jgi:hypothetical protein